MSQVCVTMTYFHHHNIYMLVGKQTHFLNKSAFNPVRCQKVVNVESVKIPVLASSFSWNVFYISMTKSSAPIYNSFWHICLGSLQETYRSQTFSSELRTNLTILVYTVLSKHNSRILKRKLCHKFFSWTQKQFLLYWYQDFDPYGRILYLFTAFSSKYDTTA